MEAAGKLEGFQPLLLSNKTLRVSTNFSGCLGRIDLGQGWRMSRGYVS